MGRATVVFRDRATGRFSATHHATLAVVVLWCCGTLAACSASSQARSALPLRQGAIAVLEATAEAPVASDVNGSLVSARERAPDVGTTTGARRGEQRRLTRERAHERLRRELHTRDHDGRLWSGGT
jgi:hypothetical protein